jgi:hypothetical protein
VLAEGDEVVVGVEHAGGVVRVEIGEVAGAAEGDRGRVGRGGPRDDVLVARRTAGVREHQRARCDRDHGGGARDGGPTALPTSMERGSSREGGEVAGGGRTGVAPFGQVGAEAVFEIQHVIAPSRRHAGG